MRTTEGLISSIALLVLSEGDGLFLGNHHLHRRWKSALYMRDSSCSENYFLPGDHVRVIATDAEACLHSLATLRVQENIKLPGTHNRWFLSFQLCPLHVR